ncbi:DNA-binding transcriptional repressor GlpR [Shigella sonnei]|nr:DNA-binding transcriptional repressor GlpR [Shigella sonnei]
MKQTQRHNGIIELVKQQGYVRAFLRQPADYSPRPQ